METFHVAIEIGDPQGTRWEGAEALVDTGSTYTWVPAPLLERLGVEPQFQREFETADGRVIQRDMAVTMLRWDGEALPTLVVFGAPSDAVLLGAYTLEGFSLAPDPVNRRLVRVRGLAMGASHLTDSSGRRPPPHLTTGCSRQTTTSRGAGRALPALPTPPRPPSRQPGSCGRR